MCIVSVPDGQGPGRCCAGRAWLRGHRPVGWGSPLWGWGSHFSPPGCGPRRRVPRRSDERGRRAGACLPNLVSATTRAATSCPGPVATLQREVPLQTEGVCLSSAHAPCHRSGRRRSGTRLPGLPSRRRRALGDPVGVWRLPASLGHAPATVTASSARPGLLNAAAAPPF